MARAPCDGTRGPDATARSPISDHIAARKRIVVAFLGGSALTTPPPASAPGGLRTWASRILFALDAGAENPSFRYGPALRDYGTGAEPLADMLRKLWFTKRTGGRSRERRGGRSQGARPPGGDLHSDSHPSGSDLDRHAGTPRFLRSTHRGRTLLRASGLGGHSSPRRTLGELRPSRAPSRPFETRPATAMSGHSSESVGDIRGHSSARRTLAELRLRSHPVSSVRDTTHHNSSVWTFIRTFREF